MLSKLKLVCLNSVTIAWAYFLAGVSALLEVLDGITDTLASPELKEQITNVIGNPKLLGRVLLGISIVTMITRLRSIRKTNV